MTQQTNPVLPAFELDCREWIVQAPDGDEPVVAVLSSVLIDDDVREASGSLRLCLLDDDPDDHPDDDPDAPAVRELSAAPGTRCWVVPVPDTAPGASRLALVAEFRLPPAGELHRRVEELMASFRWRAA